MSDERAPLLTIIIPTYQRPELIDRAVRSAMAQRIEGEPETAVEVLVIDDCSPDPVVLFEHPRLRLVRLAANKGCSGSRNEGARLARGEYISYLDDDDRLLPGMADCSIKAIRTTDLPAPVVVLSGLEVVDTQGQVTSTRLPPTLPKGALFMLEQDQPGKSFLSKQTMVVKRSVFLEIGGFDEAFRSRVYTELFLRLNQACSILGLSEVTYQLTNHEGPRISRNLELRQVSFRQLLTKHQALFIAHPQQFAQFLYKHAKTSWRLGQKGAAAKALLRAYWVHPKWSLILSAYGLKERLGRYV